MTAVTATQPTTVQSGVVRGFGELGPAGAKRSEKPPPVNLEECQDQRAFRGKRKKVAVSLNPWKRKKRQDGMDERASESRNRKLSLGKQI